MKKMMRITVTGSLIVSALAVVLWPAPQARSSGLGPTDLDHTSLRPSELQGRLWTRSEAMGLPGDIEVMGNHLVLVDRLGAPALHIIERRTGELVASIGQEGDGPGEFRAPVALDPVAGSTAVWVFDVGLQCLTRVDLVDGRLRAPLEQSPALRLRADAPILQPVWVDGDRLLAHGFVLGGRLAEFDTEGRFVRSVGPLPPNPTEIPASVLQHAYQGTLAARPDRSRLVLATRHAAMLEIYRGGGTLVGRFDGPFAFEPQVSVREASRGPVMASGDDLRFGYVDVAATDEHIYALFSGRTRAGFPGRANYAEYVHVFDWEGTFLEAFRLDIDAFSIAVHEEEGTLFAVRHLPEPAVLRYALEEER